MTSLSADPGRPPASPRGTPARRPRIPRRHRRRLLFLAVAVLLAQMAAAMLATAVRQSPTNDEPVYTVTGVHYLYEHDLRHNPEHPPLGKLLIGAGEALAGAHLDPSVTGDQYDVGRHFLYRSGNDVQRVLLAARIPVIVLTLAFGLVVFAFARDLTGAPGGLAALALYAFSPDVIAHGSLATLDVPMAGFLLTAVWLLWRARNRPRLYLPLAAVALGAAAATKMSALAAVPVLLGLAVVSLRASGRVRGASRPRRLAVYAAWTTGMAATVIAVVWASYLVADPRLRWTAPADVPSIDGARGLAVTLLPFPETFRDGMRVQLGFEDLTWTGFLFGRTYRGSLWYYLPAAIAVKTPLGTLALWAAGAASLLGVRRLRPAAPYVLVPAAVLLAAAMAGNRDLGVRYVIFLPLFLAVAAAGVTLVRWRRAPAAAVPAAALALVAFTAVSAWRASPYYLPYSNEAFGGPAKTHLRLHDSNADWGQDLVRLAEHLRKRYPGEHVWFAYKGEGIPSGHGVRASDPLTVPPGSVHGLLVVSNSWIAKSDPRITALVTGATPIDQVGHTMTIYRRP